MPHQRLDASLLILESTTRRRIVVGSGCQPVRFIGPTTSQGSLYYAFRRLANDEIAAFFGRFEPGAGRSSEAPAPTDIVSFTRTPTSVVYAEVSFPTRGEAEVRIVETDPIFEPST